MIYLRIPSPKVRRKPFSNPLNGRMHMIAGGKVWSIAPCCDLCVILRCYGKPGSNTTPGQIQVLLWPAARTAPDREQTPRSTNRKLMNDGEQCYLGCICVTPGAMTTFHTWFFKAVSTGKCWTFHLWWWEAMQVALMLPQPKRKCASPGSVHLECFNKTIAAAMKCYRYHT